MTRVWFTSDLHFGHERIVELCHRPFATVQEMDDALVHNWNSRVAPADVVWVLGDMVMHTASLPQVGRLHGRKRIVPGNHDGCHPMHKRHQRAARWYLEAGFETVVNPARRRYTLPGGVEVNLSHFPYRGGGDHTSTERYAEHRPEDEGVPLLCGHVHDKWMVQHTAAGTPMVNVGVDVWGYAPVAEETLALMLS